jgi:DnaJ-class molecular chaperone
MAKKCPECNGTGEVKRGIPFFLNVILTCNMCKGTGTV